MHFPLSAAFIDQGVKHCKSEFFVCGLSRLRLLLQDETFSEIYSGARQPFSPVNFLYHWWRFADSLAGYQQQDAHEFYISLLEGLAGSLIIPPGAPDSGDDEMNHLTPPGFEQGMGVDANVTGRMTPPPGGLMQRGLSPLPDDSAGGSDFMMGPSRCVVCEIPIRTQNLPVGCADVTHHIFQDLQFQKASYLGCSCEHSNGFCLMPLWLLTYSSDQHGSSSPCLTLACHVLSCMSVLCTSVL